MLTNVLNRFFLLGLVLLTASASFAETDRSGFYLNLGVGIQDFDHKRSIDEDTTYQVGGEYRFGDHWATELRYYNSSADSSKNAGNVDVDQYGLDGIYYFSISQDALEPYIAVGAGAGVYDYSFDDKDELQLNAGGGIRYYMTERVSLRADIRAIYGEDDDTVDSLASIGISFFFGQGGEKRGPEPVAQLDSDGDGVPDSLDQCPDTPTGVEVDAQGCPLDSDGDGVPDYLDQCPDTPKGTAVDENGCALVLSKTVSHKLDVKFANNSSELTQGSMGEIERLAQFLGKYSNTEAVITGYTDSSGAAEYNQRLSEKRAQSVKNALETKHNIDPARLTAVGKGEADPIASNDTAMGREQNRRVIVVIEAETTQ